MRSEKPTRLIEEELNLRDDSISYKIFKTHSLSRRKTSIILLDMLPETVITKLIQMPLVKKNRPLHIRWPPVIFLIESTEIIKESHKMKQLPDLASTLSPRQSMTALRVWEHVHHDMFNLSKWKEPVILILLGNSVMTSKATEARQILYQARRRIPLLLPMTRSSTSIPSPRASQRWTNSIIQVHICSANWTLPTEKPFQIKSIHTREPFPIASASTPIR